jgi:GPH family glycoside/pentoside/hexuronide:cation symporter
MTARPEKRRMPTVPKRKLLLFAFGDFAFNLYWQSVMLFLLFYYTEALELPMAVAATTYLVASIWDGIANFVAGIYVDRRQDSLRFGTLLSIGSIPVALSFVLAYLPPPNTGVVGVAMVFLCHLLFRTAYAAVNVPYLAMSARISPNDQDRAFVAGMRMLFGTAAAVSVALCTVPAGKWLTGSADTAQAYLGAAMLFAAIGTAVLALVGRTYRDAVHAEHRAPASLKDALTSLAHNKAFVSLSAAMMAMIVAITVLNKSVLYYFKYLLNDPDAGQLALASMGLISGAVIPLWMLIGRVAGLRALWLFTAGVAMIGLILFAVVDVHRAGIVQLFLVGMQAMIVGLNFVFWAMLPNTIEYGERETGLHVEGAVFGLAALLQRIAIGLATAILGWSFASAGFVANVQQSDETLAGMRATIVLVPLVFLALSCIAMWLNPLGRGTHRNIVRQLEGEAGQVVSSKLP